MSATLQSESFKDYFTGRKNALTPLFVGAKRFEVDIYHLEDMEEYLGASMGSRAKGHIRRTLPKFNNMNKVMKPELMLGADEVIVDLVKYF